MNCAFPDKPLGLTTSYRRLNKMKDVVSDVKRKIFANSHATECQVGENRGSLFLSCLKNTVLKWLTESGYKIKWSVSIRVVKGSVCQC